MIVIGRSYEVPRGKPVSAETEPPQQLQLLTPANLEACLALDQAALDWLWSRQQWLRELQEPQRLCIGLLDNEKLLAVACGWLVVDELQITAVAVTPQRRRAGLGHRVLQGLLSQARQMGASRATLEVSASNKAAAGLYARSGFASAGIRRGYYRNGDDALIQWMSLRDTEGVRISDQS